MFPVFYDLPFCTYSFILSHLISHLVGQSTINSFVIHLCNKCVSIVSAKRQSLHGVCALGRGPQGHYCDVDTGQKSWITQQQPCVDF